MSFKYSAFIENSKEARGWLESIGYERCPCVGDDSEGLIFTDHERGKFHEYDKETYGDILAEREEIGGDEVDCRGNFGLFRAIAAVTDEHDNRQWFTDGVDWCVWRDDVGEAGFEFDYFPKNMKVEEYYKASLEELINHFKK